MYKFFISAFILLLVNLSFSFSQDDSLINIVPVFKTYRLNTVNSKGLDFSPVVYENKLLYVTEREIDYVNYVENRFKKSSYLVIFYSDIIAEIDTFNYSKPKLFSNRICQLSHNGPITFSKDGNYAVFTRVEYYKKNEGKIYRPRLYSTTKENGRWKNIKLLDINKSGFSFGHPCLSPDGEYLYFASDMEGGYGGKDIYVCKKDSDQWSKQENLGPKVNSKGNELYPY